MAAAAFCYFASLCLAATPHSRFGHRPAGRVEADESDLAAAQREVREELGLDISLNGPVHTTTDQFEHESVLIENTDVFFLGRCDHHTPVLRGGTDAERNAISTMRWWTLREVERSEETIFPTDLTQVLRKYR